MKFEGAMTALVTPFRDGRVDSSALARLVEEQIAAGIHGLVAVGTTGESATLTVPEHIDVVKQVVAAAKGRVPVVAGAGANSTDEAISQSKACEEAGADALLHVCPYYNKPTQEGLYQHFAAVARSTSLPIVLYNVPGRTSSDLLPETVARLAEIETIAAIKEATGSMARASKIFEMCGDKLTLMSGDDFTTFPLLALGGRGVISVITNVMPKQFADMCNAALSGNWDRARELHYAVQPLLELLFLESNPAPTKAALEIMGKIGPEIRLPLVPCTKELSSRIRERLTAEGLI